MKYAVIGAGGTGGMIGFYMTKAGKDVTLIARGEHLAKMQEKRSDGGKNVGWLHGDAACFRDGYGALQGAAGLYFLYGNRPVTENND